MMAYDTKCDELARHFLPSERDVARLAQDIQDFIEDEINEMGLDEERL